MRQVAGVLLAAATLGFSSLAAAQSSGGPGQPSQALPGAVPGATGSGGAAWLPALIVIAGLLLIVGVAVKLADLRSKREAEAVQIQAQIADAFLRDRALFGLPVVIQALIADAFLRDRALFGLPVVATAHVPFVKGGPMIIEVTGHVPTKDLAQAAVRLAAQEASRTRPDVHVLDRVEVVPSMAARAA